MKMAKKLLAMVLASAMALCVLTGCGGGGGSSAVSMDALAKALNETGAAKFEVAEDVTVDAAAVQKVQNRVNEYLKLDSRNTITDAVEFTMAETMEDNLRNEEEGTSTSELCSIVEKSNTMSASTLAAQVVKNAEELTLTKKVGGGYHLSGSRVTLDAEATYEMVSVTLNTDKGVCTVVLFYEK